MDLLKLFDEFIEEKRSYCSPKTVLFYQENGARFLSYVLRYSSGCGSSGSWEDLHNVENTLFSKRLFISYLSDMHEKGIRNVTIRTYFRAAKAFCGWLYDNEVIDRNYTQRVKQPKSDSQIQVPLTSEEVRKIDSLFNINDSLGYRDYCLFHLMLDCGLRLAEVCDLELNEVDFRNGFLNFIGKGSKRRVVPCPSFLLEWLRIYRDHIRKGKCGRFFVNRNGWEVSTNSVQTTIQRLKKPSGVDRLHSHLLRHTFATSYILGGGNMEFLRLLLGHSDYTITQNYLHCAGTMTFLNMDIYKLDEVFFRSVCYKL